MDWLETLRRSRNIAEDVDSLREKLREAAPQNPACHGWQAFSQCDEDGIIFHCLQKIGRLVPLSKTFIEFGCGNGLENNTHMLLLSGFQGGWLDGSSANIEMIRRNLGGLAFPQLLVLHEFVVRDNMRPILKRFIETLHTDDIDFFSMDVDGNDLPLTQEALAVIRPKLLCVEYLAKFPPPISLCMKYNESHRWDSTDYQGASLQAWVDALPGYVLVSCCLSGANAFFVRRDLAEAFTAYPVETLYQRPRYWFVPNYTGHQPSFHWLRQILGTSPEREAEPPTPPARVRFKAWVKHCLKAVWHRIDRFFS